MFGRIFILLFLLKCPIYSQNLSSVIVQNQLDSLEILNKLQTLNSLIELYPSFSAAYQNRGDLYFQLGYYENAIIDYNRALQIDVDNPYLFYKKGLANNKIGQFNDAISDLTNAIQLKLNFHEAFLERAYAKNLTGDWNGAIQDCKYSLDIFQSCEAHFYMGFAYHKLQKYNNAVLQFDKAIESKPQNPIAYLNRGYAKFKLNDFENACEDIYLASDLGYDRAIEAITEICQ